MGWLTERGAEPGFVKQVSARLKALNEAISADQNLGPGFAVGHSYFCGNSVGLNADVYERTVENQILPLLCEYWFDDQGQVKKWSDQLLAPFDL